MSLQLLTNLSLSEIKRMHFLLEKLAEQEYDRFFADPDHLGLEELEYIEEALRLVGSPRASAVARRIETLTLEQC